MIFAHLHSSMDEVFFSYVTGLLEELGSQESTEEDFEMETFIEMLEGYIPGFAEIGRYVYKAVLYTFLTLYLKPKKEHFVFGREGLKTVRIRCCMCPGDLLEGNREILY